MIPRTTNVAELTAAEEAARRRRARRFVLLLLAFVLLLAGATVGYVELYGHVLRDPERPPTVTSPDNPRVFVFEFVLAAAMVVAVTAFVLLRRRKAP